MRDTSNAGIRPEYYYNSEALEQLKSLLWVNPAAESRPFPRTFRSIWRILHIDGFENRGMRFTYIVGREAYLR